MPAAVKLHSDCLTVITLGIKNAHLAQYRVLHLVEPLRRSGARMELDVQERERLEQLTGAYVVLLRFVALLCYVVQQQLLLCQHGSLLCLQCLEECSVTLLHCSFLASLLVGQCLHK